MELRKDFIEWYAKQAGHDTDTLADDDNSGECSIDLRAVDTVLKILLTMAKDHEARIAALE
ncbi:MAG: hypothetical protein ACYTEX_25640 [Planctomycetota bacterium]|jgi:hypothetical protein